MNETVDGPQTDIDGDERDDGAVNAAARRRVVRVAGGVSALTLLLFAGLWTQRRPIADHFIAQEFAARGIEARYQVTRIGPRTQRLDNVVLGDPARPDLVARSVEVDLGFAGLSPTIRAVRAEGVRLRGSYRGGTLSLGALDKFMRGGEGAKGLPDIDLTMVDGRGTLATDYGDLGLVLNGSGALRGGFEGRLVAAARALRTPDCFAVRPLISVAVAVESDTINFKGPLTSPALRCAAAGLVLAAPRIDADARLSSDFASARGALTLAMPAAAQGGMRLAGLSGLLTFEGKLPTLEGSHAFSARAVRAPDMRAGRAKLGGRFAIRMGGDQASSISGTLTMDDLALAGGSPLRALPRSVAGTPVAPLAARFARAVDRAGEGNRLVATGRVTSASGGTRTLLSSLRLVADSGARLELGEGTGLTYDLPSGRWTLDGGVMLAGGGFPEAQLTARQLADGGIAGAFQMDPYEADEARLALSPLRFARRPDGTIRLATVASLDGPLPDGAVRSLTVPIDAAIAPNGHVALAHGCLPVRWTALRLASARLDPASLRLCPERGGAALAFGPKGVEGAVTLGALRLGGRIGDSPFAVHAGGARLRLSDMGFALDDLAVRIGAGEAPVRLSAASLAGAAGPDGGLGGTLAGGQARIGSVPLDLSAIAGRWTFRDAKLALDGALDVADAAPDRRFNPLHVPDAHLDLIGGRIAANGTLVHPARARPVATVTIGHDLGTGAGKADFDIGNLALGEALQPDDLTPLALGVVANVHGVVTGAGQIVWNQQGVSSTGRFATSDMALAAAFGPIEGLSTTLNFEDLLGLRTAPGQVLTMRTVNPGIEVHDGEIRYALASSSQARIEGGRWPFANGVLELLPATLDLDAKKARHLVFRVTGMEAGAFINTLELKDISATGVYDGLLPMVFDANGGRIEGGILVARQQGLPPLVVRDAASLTVPCDQAKTAGTLAYVGEVSNAQLGTFGKLAFDALKNLRYKCLTILLDGALDGEFVTRIAINGVNQGAPAAASSAITRPFLGLPFLFNVRIEAPFRGLLNTARSFTDPSGLIRDSLGPQYQTVIGVQNGATNDKGLAVQATDSDKTLSKDRK